MRIPLRAKRTKPRVRTFHRLRLIIIPRTARFETATGLITSRKCLIFGPTRCRYSHQAQTWTVPE